MSIAGPWKQIGKLSKDIGKYGLMLAECFRVIPGAGDAVAFWKDKWAGNEPLKDMFPILFELERSKNVSVAERVKNVNGTMILNFSWVRQLASAEEVEDVQSLSEVVLGAAREHGPDRWLWERDGSGMFSVKSIKDALQHARFSDLGNNFEWNNWVPIKINFLAWRVSLDRVPTLAALAHRNVHVGHMGCRLCEQFVEDSDHLFVSCEVAQFIWDSISNWCRISSIYAFTVKDILDWHNNVQGNDVWRKLIYAIMQVAIWVIWRSRNEATFNGKQINREQMVNEVKHLSFLWVGSRSRLKEVSWEEWCNFDMSSKCL
ncbi:putative reverse transcriptase zinc-binding domain-containing protein [Helianthus annuus]|nr:putative reverse transcriptase zinc-binding domain-containing protein [Helianthus annuus]